MDGTHVAAMIPAAVMEEGVSYHSFKLKKNAYNTLMGVTFDKIIFYVSESKPAGTFNDQAMWNEYGAKYRAKLECNEITIADGAFSKHHYETKTFGKFCTELFISNVFA